MGFPRCRYVQEGKEGVYHCFNRCVRRAFLCGHDALTGRDFSHRKAWLVERMRNLATIFAIDVCSYSVMETHYHTILRTRPDVVASWTDREVARRWLTLFPRHSSKRGTADSLEAAIDALADCRERIAKLRQRFSSVSWFMGRLNEFIARAANKEDGVKGRFWESRFKCQVLLDEAAIAACMVYVDLNPIRAGVAESPEESDFTSIQERIRAWQREMRTVSLDSSTAERGTRADACDTAKRERREVGVDPEPFPECALALSETAEVPLSAGWLCPIQSDSRGRGILRMTASAYFDLVDRSGRMTRLDTRGAIDADLAPILLRIGANPEAWLETVSYFGSRFRLAAGATSNLRRFADQLGRRWLTGVSAARASFLLSVPLLT